MLRRVLFATLSLCLGLRAQDARLFQELSKGTLGCPRVGSSAAHSVSGTRPLVDISTDQLVAKGVRKPASGFGVLNVDGSSQTVADLKGRIVVVGFWSTKCEASMKLLQEFRNFQKQSAERKMNLVFWPVHFEAWPEVLGFLRTKQQYFDGVEVKRLALGENGLSNLVENLDVLPTTFVLDKEGRIATSWTGFREGQLLARINQMLAER